MGDGTMLGVASVVLGHLKQMCSYGEDEDAVPPSEQL